MYADRFEALELVEKGDLASVWRARDRSTDQMVALKVLTEEDATMALRFEQETRLLAELCHPAIVGYVAHGVAGAGERFLAMEWLEGESLEERLVKGPISPARSLYLGQRVAEALAVAHEQGVLHRDVKPANLFLVGGRLDAVKLLDFGLARRMIEPRPITRAGFTLGTPMYMSPEQARGASDIDARADIFSLGCVLYECLTGQPPFTGTGSTAVLAKICLDEPLDLEGRCAGMSPALRRLLGRLLAKDRRDRPGSARALAEELAALSGQAGLRGVERREKPARREAPARAVRGPRRTLAAVIATFTPAAGDGELRAAEMAVGDGLLADLRRALEPSGVRLDRLTGGALVLTLTGGESLLEVATRAARAALYLRGRLPESAIGVGVGHAAGKTPLPIGEILDCTGSVAAGSAPGSIGLDAESAAWLEASFHVSEGTARTLVGEFPWIPEGRVLLGKSHALLGRDAELARLERLVDQCANSATAQVAMLVAPVGGGKTRLCDELCQRLGQRSLPMTIMRGRIDPLRTGAPFGLLQSALRSAAAASSDPSVAAVRDRIESHVVRRVGAHAGPDVAAALLSACLVGVKKRELAGRAFAGQAAPSDGVLASWIAWLRAECEARPTLVIVDDLQWADSVSLRVLQAALGALRDRPFMLVGCTRPEMVDRLTLVGPDQPLVRLPLAALTSKAAQRLAHNALGPMPEERGAWLVDQAGGNPLLLEEMLRAFRKQGVAGGADKGLWRTSRTPYALVSERLRALPAEARQVIGAASIFGDAFEREAVAHVLAAAGAAAAARFVPVLLAEELVERAPAAYEMTYRFRHSSIRDAAYQMLAPGDRVRAHLRAGEWLERQVDPDAFELAEHFRLGGDPVRAGQWAARVAPAVRLADDILVTVERIGKRPGGFTLH